MITRRHLLACTAAASLLATAGPWGRALAQAAVPAPEATAFVTRLGSALVGIIDGPGTYDDKKRRLQPLVEAAVDVEGLARFCLGRYQRTATPPQMQEFTQLFRAVLMNNIFGKIGEFQGVTFTPTTTIARDGGTQVGTLIKRPNQQPNTVQWVVAPIAGAPRIIDVVAEGVSLRLTQQSDYAAFLSRNNGDVSALIAAMRNQVGR